MTVLFCRLVIPVKPTVRPELFEPQATEGEQQLEQLVLRQAQHERTSIGPMPFLRLPRRQRQVLLRLHRQQAPLR